MNSHGQTMVLKAGIRHSRPISSGSGGGGSMGSGPPLLGHDVGFLTLGPKLDPLLDPPPFFLLVDLRWTLVADPGCVCDRGDHPHPWNVDDVTRAMSKGGGLVKIPVSAPGPPPPSKILDPPLPMQVVTTSTSGVSSASCSERRPWHQCG